MSALSFFESDKIGIVTEDIKQDKDSDIFAVENGYISITPVHINMTETNRIEELKELIFNKELKAKEA